MREDEALQQADIGKSGSDYVAPAPSDFHAELCRQIRKARRRVKLASLYVGAAADEGSQREAEFLDAIEHAASGGKNLDLKILLDANRALRPVKKGSAGTTSSAEALYERIRKGTDEEHGEDFTDEITEEGLVEHGLYLFNFLNEPLRSLLPSPLNEVAGVFHIKAYIVDDSLILSGANLSEEYFTDRQDRYMLFVNGGGGLVDFYSDLIDVLCDYGYRYRGDSGKTHFSTAQKLAMAESLSTLFDGSVDAVGEEGSSSGAAGKSCNEASDIIAYAVPTFQAPRSFFPPTKRSPFPYDVQVTRNLLLAALEDDPASSVRISSAYLNPTPSLMSALKRFGAYNRGGENESKGAAHLLTAGPASHGFAPKRGKTEGWHGSGRQWIPSAYAELTNQAAMHIVPHGGTVLLYERDGWTFHSKGLWLSSSSHCDQSTTLQDGHLCDPRDVQVTIVGSGNYGVRSEELDIESNCIVVLKQDADEFESEGSKWLRSSLANEWNDMCDSASEHRFNEDGSSGQDLLRVALPLIRKFV